MTEGDESQPNDDSAERPSEAVEPSVPTAAYGEYTCKRCQTTVERGWRDEEEKGYVCSSCESW
ncbi:DUF7573 domain-containing protein [Natrialbaceae archaeon AArc-T1-2]|uniref:DUF7573 domain-containing protein n=1 Tax=Natrialbaceae archaeon AArc-T1-2 TaxID=3053904 RepID=UPI003D2F95C5